MKEAGVHITIGMEFRPELGRITSFYRLVQSGSNDVMLVMNKGESKRSFLKRVLAFTKENRLILPSVHHHSVLLDDCIEGWEKLSVCVTYEKNRNEGYYYFHDEMERHYLVDYTIDVTAVKGYSWWLRDDQGKLLSKRLPDLSAANECLRDHLRKRRLKDLITS